MGSFSKILPYSCYELGHCWKHSCSSASFEICIIGFVESLKIYGVVYLLTGLVNAQKISMKYGKKLLKDYLTSVCFLTVNAFGYIGSYCVVRVFLGKEESGLMVSHRQTAARQECIPHQPVPWHQKLLALITSKHYLCPHRGGCVPHFIWTGLQGFARGFLLQLSLKMVTSIPRVVRAPRKLLPLLINKNNMEAGLFLGCFTSLFKGTCCGGRWWHGEDRPESGAIAGVLAALSMYFYSAPSLALYMMWKVVESMYENGCNAGYLPRIPGSVELLYAISTGYLFHVSVMEQHHMKPSYWRFLRRLTWDRLAGYNRHLLAPYGFDSGKNYPGYWPDYDLKHISETVKCLQPAP